MMTASTNLHAVPYIGPRAFDTSERRFFCGRDNETDILTSLVMAHRVSLFFAQSGAGKSSLLRAGLIPKVTRQKQIGWGDRARLSQMMEVLPILTVGKALPTRQTRPSDNIFVFSSLLGLLETSPPDELASLTLTEGLTRRLESTPLGDDAPPIEGQTQLPLEKPEITLLIFDQFEELFTRHIDRWPEREGFFQQINQALAEHADLHVLFAIREDYIAQLTPYAPLLPEQLRHRFRLERLQREAAIAAVELPARRATPSRDFAPGVAEALVDNLRRIQVKQTANRPNGDNKPDPVILGEYIEPVHLQIVCQQLWEQLPADQTTIQATHVQNFGDVDEALTSFYETALHKALAATAAPNPPEGESTNLPPSGARPEQSRRGDRGGASPPQPQPSPDPTQDTPENTPPSAAPETPDASTPSQSPPARGRSQNHLQSPNLQSPPPTLSQRALRRWFSTELITPARTKGLVYRDEEKRETKGLPNAAADSLNNSYIIRADIRGGDTWYELAHDRLVEPILAANQKWLADYYNPLADPTTAWLTAGHSPELLLEGAPLREAERYAEQQPQELTADERLFLEESLRRETQLAEEKREAERRRRITIGIGLVVIVVLLALTAWAVQQQTEAKNQAKIAGDNAATATFALGDAERQAGIAENNAATATFALGDAERQAATAVAAEATAANESATAEAARAVAEQEKQRAELQYLAALAPDLLDQTHDFELAALVALEVFYLSQQIENSPMDLVDSALRDILSTPYRRTDLGEGTLPLVFSPNQQMLVTNYNLWDLTKPNKKPYRLPASNEGFDWVTSVAFSRDGELLAKASDDGTVMLIDPADLNKSPQQLPVNPDDNITFVAFIENNSLDGNGQSLMTLGSDGNLSLWELVNLKEPLRQFSLTDSEDISIRSAQISQDGLHLVALGNGEVLYWYLNLFSSDVLSPMSLINEDINQERIEGIAFHPDRAILATYGYAGKVRLYQLSPNLNEILSTQELEGNSNDIVSIALSPDGKWLAGGSESATVWLWDLDNINKSPDELVVRSDTNEGIWGMSFSPDSQTLVAANDTSVRLWDIGHPPAAPIELRLSSWVRTIALSKNNLSNGNISKLAAGSNDEVWIWNDPNKTPQLLMEDEPFMEVADHLTFSKSGQMLAGALNYSGIPSFNEGVNLWDLSDPALSPPPDMVLPQSSIITAPINSLAFSQDEQMLAAGIGYRYNDTTIGAVLLWNLNSPDEEPTIVQNSAVIVDVVKFSPDGQFLIAGNEDESIRIWDAGKINEVPKILNIPSSNNDISRSGINDISINPDKRQLLVATTSGLVWAWDLDKLEEPQLVLDKENKMYWKKFSPDGQILAGIRTASESNVIFLIDLADPNGSLIPVTSYLEFLASVDFSSDGQILATSSSDGTIKLSLTKTENLADLVCQQVRRNLTRQEWEAYFSGQEYRQTCPNLPPYPSLDQ
ncbi:MAG: hypothetical protein KDJ65_20530 [Anaerolineae bacterium]|nr:hypothetical protein [Anaerolineae bacterium]